MCMRSINILCSFQELTHSPFYFKSFASLPLVDFQSTDMVVLKYLSCCVVAVRGRNLPTSSLCRAGSIAYLSLLFYMDKSYLYLLIFCCRCWLAYMLFKLKAPVEKVSLTILQTFLFKFSMNATKIFSVWKKYLVKRNFQPLWDVYLRKTYKKGHSEKMENKNRKKIILNENELLNYLLDYFFKIFIYLVVLGLSCSRWAP